jgi:ipoprotein LpqH
MKHALILGMTSAAVVAALAGCSTSSKESGTTTTGSAAATAGAAAPGTSAPETTAAPAARPGTGRVSLNNADLSAVTGVSCQTDAGVTTITVDSTPKTTVVLTDEAGPAVKSVSIGELGGDGPSVAYVEGVTGAPAQATHDGNTYTVSGTGTGAEASDPTKPVDLPFEIAATCP